MDYLNALFDPLRYFDYAYLVFAVFIFVAAFEYSTPMGDRNAMVHTVLVLLDKYATLLLVIFMLVFVLQQPIKSFVLGFGIGRPLAIALVMSPLVLFTVAMHRYRKWLVMLVPTYYFYLTLFRTSTW